MKLALIHVGLLLAALAFAYQTWTSEQAAPASPGSVFLWEADPDDVTSITYASETVNAVVERREDDAGVYYWATVQSLREASAPADPTTSAGDSTTPSDSLGAGDSIAADAPTAELSEPLRSVSFVVGEQGEQLIENAAAPQALREFGVPDGQSVQEYGLADSIAHLTVEAGRTRELEVGGTPWGASSRYVRDPSTGEAFAMRGDIFRSLEDAERRLPERRLHTFGLADVARVSVSTADGELSMWRGESAVPPFTWTAAEGGAQPDQSFANFMDRAGQLSVLEFAPDLDPESLSHVVRLDYFDPDGGSIGFVDLYRGPIEGELPTYYVRTELSRVLAEIYAPLGDQVEQDAAQLF